MKFEHSFTMDKFYNEEMQKDKRIVPHSNVFSRFKTEAFLLYMIIFLVLLQTIKTNNF